MQPTIYTPFSQTPFLWAYVMVRTTGDPSALTRSIKGMVRSVDPNLVAASVRPMTEVVSGTVAEPRLSMLLVSGFALLALILASVGIYGVIAYSVSQRTHELGVADGARRRTRRRAGDDHSRGMVMAAIGIATGLGAAALATRLMSDLLVGITPRDPLTFAGGAALAADHCRRGKLPARTTRDTRRSDGRFTGRAEPVNSQPPTANSQREPLAASG